MKRTVKFLLATGLVASSAFLQSCTDLTEKVYDALPTENFLKNDAQIAAALGPAYGGLRDYAWNMHNAEATSDVMLVPTRGKDWYDGGDWLNYHRHTWNSLHGPINGIWGFCFENISRINQLIPAVSTNESAVAELRAVRAFYYFILCDTFGNVPISTGLQDANSDQRSRADVYAFIEKELLESVSKLPKGRAYARMTEMSARTLLAKLYLNAGVYKGTAEWTKCKEQCDLVINSGLYALEGNFFSNFTISNEGSKENIWAVPFDRFKAGGMNIHMRTLHYASQQTFGLNAAPWNGFCTLAEFYRTFENADVRRNMFLAGPQFSADGKRLKDDSGNDLSFLVDFTKDEMTSGDSEYQSAGARWAKYEIQRNNTSNDQDNDWAMFRLSDVHLMRAEANFRTGATAAALADINPVRARAGATAWTVADVTADNLLAERGRELAGESWRRQDLVRFGKYNEVGGRFTSKFMKAGNARNSLFPIPQARLDANPKLKQNPGY
jgi:starch-binding outer membrane protein, SusD/RagB family